ncbi:NADP-binding protein [Dacryopinax primogenitus]|uniref:NADP-binding protein n=1 Tax=Dacryopinax primogenitus (strain DJM 731) TaxID=1858805 RepID=M5GEE4_DACPD|nr:NADP-binding protein [Dacryopinax primogenitus]EJU03178.1 NADP-binding protein [Dacryopinax primogenitus]
MVQLAKEPQVWLITGALSGFGRIMTEHVLAQGDSCVATSLDPSALEDLCTQYGPKLLNLHLDVTRPSEVLAAFQAAKAHFGHVDIVFNNAGIGLSGIVESVPEEAARKLFDVNFWGSTGVTRDSVRFFREENGGRGGKLLVMSSSSGISGAPFAGYYSAAKHAVEGITTTVMREIKPEWNIHITLVEPGWFLTPIFRLPPERSFACPEVYGGETFKAARMASIKRPGDPVKAVALMYDVMQREKLPAHLPIGDIAIQSVRAVGRMWTKVAEEWEEECCKPEYGVAVPLNQVG